MRRVLKELQTIDMSGDPKDAWEALLGRLRARGARLPAADMHNMEATLQELTKRGAGARWVVVVAGNCCHPINAHQFVTYGWRDGTGGYSGDAKSGTTVRVRGWQAGVQRAGLN